MVDLPRRELAVPLRKSLPVWAPIIVVAAVAIGASVAGGLRGGQLLLAAVGMLGLLLAGVALLRPPTLVVDPTGMSLHTPLGERWRMPWSECEDFRVWQRTTVVWVSQAEAARHPRAAASWRKRAGADIGLLAHFGGLDAPDLAALLDRYRLAAARIT